jgi:hypothetical protein
MRETDIAIETVGGRDRGGLGVAAARILPDAPGGLGRRLVIALTLVS